MRKIITFFIAVILFVSIPTNVLATETHLGQQFSDVNVTDWFYPYVSGLAEKGHINGYTDGTFKPQNNIRVSEFTKILVVALGYETDAPKNGYWAEGYINKARELNIIKDGEFDNYDRYITRGEMARMIVRAAKSTNNLSLDIPENYIDYSTSITDYSALDSSSQDIALKVFTSGIITGLPDGSFGFEKNATRAETCTILIRFLEKDQRKVPLLSDEELKNSMTKYNGQNETGANYDSSIQFYTKDGLNVTSRLLSYTSYEYPYMGSEYITGPEKTVYYAIYYDGNGEPIYGESIREADDFVLMRVYPDGTTMEFTAPELTEKQKQDFIDKYDPKKVKERIAEEEKRMKREYNDMFQDLEDSGLLNIYKGSNFLIYRYTRPDERVFSSIISSFSEINYGNDIKENFYASDIEKVEKKIISKLEDADLLVPLKIFIAPYKCEDFPQGGMQYRNFDEYGGITGIEMILFNNSTNLEEQFEIQFEEYIQEAKILY